MPRSFPVPLPSCNNIFNVKYSIYALSSVSRGTFYTNLYEYFKRHNQGVLIEVHSQYPYTHFFPGFVRCIKRLSRHKNQGEKHSLILFHGSLDTLLTDLQSQFHHGHGYGCDRVPAPLSVYLLADTACQFPWLYPLKTQDCVIRVV